MIYLDTLVLIFAGFFFNWLYGLHINVSFSFSKLIKYGCKYFRPNFQGTAAFLRSAMLPWKMAEQLIILWGTVHLVTKSNEVIPFTKYSLKLGLSQSDSKTLANMVHDRFYVTAAWCWRPCAPSEIQACRPGHIYCQIASVPVRLPNPFDGPDAKSRNL